VKAKLRVRQRASTIGQVEYHRKVVRGLGLRGPGSEVVVANSLHGYLYLTTDSGDSWTKVRREFGEIRAVTWVPN